MVSCQLKAVKEVTSNKAIMHENLPIKAMQKVPLSSPVNKLSKAGLPCCSYLNNLRSLTHH
jgi:hypothetical protein